MEKKKQDSLRCIQMTLFDDNTCLLSAVSPLKINTKLYCDLKRNRIYIQQKKLSNKKVKATLYYSLFIGIFNINKHNFFFFAEDVKKVGKIRSHSVYQIKSVSYVPFDDNEISDEFIEKLLFISNHLSKGYYFSFTLDLSKSFDRAFEFNDSFYVNKKLQNFLLLNEKMKGWAVPIIKGFVKTRILEIEGKRLRYTLLAKLCSGTDNVVEVNQIIENETILKINRYLLLDCKPIKLDEYINVVADNNAKVLILNTISSSKTDLISKINGIEKVAKNLTLSNSQVKYKYFVLNEKVEDEEELQALQNDFKELYRINKDFGFSQFNAKNQKEKKQNGFYIFLFCNKIKTTALYSLLFNLFDELINFLFENQYLDIFSEASYTFKDINKLTGFDFLSINEKMHRNINLLLNDVYFNHLTTLLDKRINTVNKAYLNRNRELYEKAMAESDFEMIPEIGKQTLKIMVISYNIAGNSPTGEGASLSHFFDKINNHKPDILALGFQEIIELKIKLKNVKKMLNSIEVIKKWEYLFIRELSEYKLITEENCLGLQSFIFVKKTKLPFLMSHSTEKVKLGFAKLGNKGAIINYINYKGIFLEFINCHLSAGFGEQKREQRLSDITNIFKATANSNFRRKLSASFFYGDTNFKIEMLREDALKIIKNSVNPFQELETFDDAIYMKAFHSVFKEYEEKPVHFAPTYKYNKHTRQFENIKKTPSWTDRIYYRLFGDTKLNCQGYTSLPIYLSDHHPVFFKCDITK